MERGNEKQKRGSETESRAKKSRVKHRVGGGGGGVREQRKREKVTETGKEQIALPPPLAVPAALHRQTGSVDSESARLELGP